MRSIGLATLLVGRLAAAADGAPLIPLSFFLRGGSAATAAAVATESTEKQRRQHQRQRQRGDGVNPIQLATKNARRGMEMAGDRMRRDASDLGKNVGRELGKVASSTRRFVADVPKIVLPGGALRLQLRRRGLKSCKRLDEVCHAFSSVQRGNGEVDMAQLLKACRAHLAFMRSGGPSLRLVAKDLESNVKKAEKVFRKSPKGSRSLSSLLEREKGAGTHNGDELGERSAAMGLLWIRRSLAFQLDLYASLADRAGQGVHPRDAARDAYVRHLSPFHGWALRRVFPASLSQMPDRETFMAKFGGIEPHELNDAYERMIAGKLRKLVESWDPLIEQWEGEFERLGLEDTRRV